MRPELALPAAFLLAALTTFATTPWALRLAVRTGFLDRPAGYKGHGRPTPYLGGTAIAAGVAISCFAFAGGTRAVAVIVLCSLALAVLGTVDDRTNLAPSLRVLVEAGVGLVLWTTGHGWGVLGSAPADAALTVVWVVGIVNAFNLMDNMDGAAASTAGVSALGAGALALEAGRPALAVLAVGVAGACAGFLPANLARPSRIFMGDGGSMLLGMLVASLAVAATMAGETHVAGLAGAALLVGLAILDTALVLISRTRGGRPVLSGGRDHLTHRLQRRLGTPGRVALALAVGQSGLCIVAVACTAAGTGWLFGAGLLAAGLGVGAIVRLESPVWDGRVAGESPALAPAPAAIVRATA